MIEPPPLNTPFPVGPVVGPWMRWFRALRETVERIQAQGGVAVSVAWTAITGKPDTFPPSTHTHSQYLTNETDPTVPVHVKGISAEQIAAWDAPEADPTVPAHVKAIQQADLDRWNALETRTTTISGDASGSGVASVPVTVTGVHGHDVPTPTAGFLRWNGTAWVFVEGDLPETAGLNDLSDVTLASPITNDALEFHGGEWVNRPRFYEHIQLSPSAAWVVAHNLGRPPVGLSIYDSSGRAVGCAIEHDEPTWNAFTVRPGTAVGGRVTWI